MPVLSTDLVYLLLLVVIKLNDDGVVVRGGEHLMNIAPNSLLYSSETMTTIFYAIHLYLTIPYFI